MFTGNYAESKAYQNELIRQAECGRILKSAKHRQEKNINIKQFINRFRRVHKQTVRDLELETL